MQAIGHPCPKSIQVTLEQTAPGRHVIDDEQSALAADLTIALLIMVEVRTMPGMAERAVEHWIHHLQDHFAIGMPRADAIKHGFKIGAGFLHGDAKAGTGVIHLKLDEHHIRSMRQNTPLEVFKPPAGMHARLRSI